MTDDFIILSDAELEQVSGGAAFPFVHPVDPSAPHGGWPKPRPEPQASATSPLNNPDLYRWGTSTANEF
jgi:bacteriocin-like protein